MCDVVTYIHNWMQHLNALPIWILLHVGIFLKKRWITLATTFRKLSSALETEDDDSDNDIFYTPPSSPFEPIFVELEECLVIDRCKRHSCILLDEYLQICDQVLYPQLGWPCHPPRLTLKFMEKN